MAKEKSRVVELQAALKIARDALERIKDGRCGTSPHQVADAALERMWPLERKQPLQGLVGHERAAHVGRR